MNRSKKITWATNHLVASSAVFLALAVFCFFAAWSLNDHAIHLTVYNVLPVLLLCITGAAFTVYAIKRPLRLQKLILQRLTETGSREKRDRAIVNALPDMVFIIDCDGHYIDFSNAADKESIVNPENFLSRKVSDILAGSLAAEVMTYIKQVLKTGQTINHSYQLEVKGKIRSYESRYVPHEKNNVMVLVRDTTEVKITEQKIKESEYKYRMLVEHATDSIFIANFQGNFLVVNPAGCKLSQYTEEELLKMRFHDLAISDELKLMPYKLAEIASGTTASSERKMKRKDGQIIDVEIAARIIAPNRFLAFVRDITVRKKAENELIKSKEHLQQLNTYIENIREAERLNVSREIHDELGQQLAVLKMDLSRMGKRIALTDAYLSEQLPALFETINKMIDAVRKISAELRPGMLDDIGLVATLDWYCDDFTKRTGIKTSFASAIADDKFSKELNVGLFRIFQESLLNVAKYSGAEKVDVLIRNQDEQLVLLIEDNGKSPDHSSDQHRNLGLGVMKERALLLRGTYSVNCFPGKCTIVEVCVPLGPAN